MNDFQPLLAGTVSDINKLIFPLIASPKLDGIRCIIINGKAYTRKLKPIPNKYIREVLEAMTPFTKDYVLDGEIMLDKGTDFNLIQSAVMSFEGEPRFTYHVFDCIRNNDPMVHYCKRLQKLPTVQRTILPLEVDEVKNIEELMMLEEKYVRLGYEGVMLRSHTGKYKFGRSTEKESILLKLKRFFDAEAVVVGFEEKMKNNNTKEKDELGYAKRSSAKAGLAPAGTLGSLVVQDCKSGKEFSIGSGFDDATRRMIWDNREDYRGEIVTYKYQELSKYGIPRFPVYKCFRYD